MDIIKVTKLENIPGLATFIDFEKAFIVVDWNFASFQLWSSHSNVDSVKPITLTAAAVLSLADKHPSFF